MSRNGANVASYLSSLTFWGLFAHHAADSFTFKDAVVPFKELRCQTIQNAFKIFAGTGEGEAIHRFQLLTVPLQLDALHLPFAEGYFDAVVSVGAYHYFGNNDSYFTQVLEPVLKKDAIVAIAFPGMKYEVHEKIPEEMKTLWEPEALEMWHSIDWWKLKFEPYLKNFQIYEMDCFDKVWEDWLGGGNPYAKEINQ